MPTRVRSSNRLTCREFVAFLDDYVAGELPEDRAAVFEAHLSACPPCVAYVNGYRLTVELGREALRISDARLPDDVPDELLRAILAARGPGKENAE